MHVMLDLETLGTRPDAAIIQIGAVLFEPRSGGRLYNNHGFNRHVMVQDGSGTIDHDTLCFWLTENSAGKMGEALGHKADPLSTVLNAFVLWPELAIDGLNWNGIDGIWANPSDFDIPIMKSAFARCGINVPWNRRATRDCRTLWALTPSGVRPTVDETGFTYHDALDDAIGQAMAVQKAFQELQG